MNNSRKMHTKIFINPFYDRKIWDYEIRYLDSNLNKYNNIIDYKKNIKVGNIR